MSHRHDEKELNQLEAMLRSLKPEIDINRDQLLFRAGQASMPRRSNRIVPVVAALVGVVVGVWAARSFFLPTVPGVERIVIVYVKPDPAPQPEPLPEVPPQQPSKSSPVPASQTTVAQELSPLPGREGYLGLRDQVLRWGVDMMPSSPVNLENPGGQPSSSLLEWQTKIAGKPMQF
jgi:hypothetical protein